MYNMIDRVITFDLRDLINKKIIIEQMIFKGERKTITYAKDLETDVLYILDIKDISGGNF